LLNEKGSMSYSELWESYRERCKQRVNYEIVRRHIDYMERKGLITIEKGKPNLIRVTKKGLDYVFLVSRIEALLGESISC
jgi:predicted transcriptional regulator